MSPLFQTGTFKLHSGAYTHWKIDCDFLTDEDIEAIAITMLPKLGHYSSVESVPTGGDRLAAAFKKHIYTDGGLLVVDDVFTTGVSMEEIRAGRLAQGIVIFARNPTPWWIQPLFLMV